MDFTEAYFVISASNRKIIYHARKSLLFNNQETWMEKQTELFGINDGTKVLELTS